MATNKESKIRTIGQAKAETNGKKTGLKDIAEVRMLLYVVPIACILALFVYFVTR
jgi:hypothetical protein